MRVPEYTPNVSPRPAFRQGIDVSATPAAFGAGIGQGMQEVASGLATASNAVAQVQDLENETVVRRARNDYMQALDTLQYEPSQGYLQKSGKTALDDFDGYNRSVGELRSRFATGLTPVQQNLFSRTIDPVERDARRSGLIHRAGALKSFVTEEATAGADNWANMAVSKYRDPVLHQKYVMAGVHELDALGEKLGWPAEKRRQTQTDYVSGISKATALQLAQDDPVAAVEYVAKNRDRMNAAEYLNAMQEIAPTVGGAVTRDAVATRAANPGPKQFAAAGLPPEAYQLLSVISGVESPDYNMLNGGERVPNLSDHPRRAGAGGTSTAAGRYQFVRGTWDRAAQALNLPNFGPASQDIAAWWLAQSDYKDRTGRDLLADVRAGKLADVRAGLADTWEGIKDLKDDAFAERMRAAVGSGAGVAADGEVRFSPRVEAVLATLPANYAARLREVADTGVAKAETEAQSQLKAYRLATVDGYKLRIANDDPSLSRQEVMDDPVIDQGDKATLLNSLDAQLGAAANVRKAAAAYQAGELVIDPYSSDGRKLVDGLWKSIVADTGGASGSGGSATGTGSSGAAGVLAALGMAGVSTGAGTRGGPAAAGGAAAGGERGGSGTGRSSNLASLEELVRQAGIVPQPVMNALRGDLASGDVRRVALAACLAARLNVIDPGALERRDGGSEVAKAAVAYSHLADVVGLTPSQAAQRMVDARDPEKARDRAALMQSDAVKDFIKAQATEDRVRDIFDPGLFGFDPALGATPAQAAAMTAEYRGMLEESVVDAAGDQDLARSMAAQRFQRRYGTSNLTMAGPKVVTRLPPEATYPAGPDGTWEYIREQVKREFSASGIAADKVYLQSDEQTERDSRSGRPPRYQVWYQKDGVLERYHLPFFATAPSKEDLTAARRARSEQRRNENRAELEAGRDRERNLDRFLHGNPLTGGL